MSLNTASVFKLSKLFVNLSIPWITEDLRIHWQKFTNASVRNSMDDIVKGPKSNAHGAHRAIRKRAALKWKDALEKLADRLDEIVAGYINQETGTRPWQQILPLGINYSFILSTDFFCIQIIGILLHSPYGFPFDEMEILCSVHYWALRF